MRPPPTHIPETLDELRAEFARLAEDYQAAYHELLQLRRLAFGQKRETLTILSDQQMAMDGLLGLKDAASPEDLPRQVSAHTRKARRAPAELERITLVHDIPEADKTCACGGAMEKVGESHTLIRQYIPSRCEHEDHVYPRYACARCQGEVRQALEPASPFEAQGIGSGLAAQILLSKHEDHIPLSRQEKIFERQGIVLAKSHMVDILARAHELLSGIVEPIRQEVLRSGLVGMDETPMPVLDENLKGKTHRGYFWTLGSEDAVLYRFSAGREGENIFSLLGEDYTGYVVADGYSAYDPKTRPRKYTLVNCWAHARRKFYDLMGDQPLAREAVARIGAMYHIESELRKGPNPLDALAEARRSRIGPLLDDFWEWLLEKEHTVLPKSALGGAIRYALDRKAALSVFLDDPRIPMDNNQSERDLRHVVIGRKNWNFAGSYDGAERLADFFTLTQSCKRIKLNPWLYLTHVFSVIEDHPVHRLEELTPSRIKAKFQAAANDSNP